MKGASSFCGRSLELTRIFSPLNHPFNFNDQSFNYSHANTGPPNLQTAQVLNTRYGGKATEEEQLNRQRAHEHTKIFGGVLLVWIFLVWNIVQITQNHTNHRFDVDKNGRFQKK